MREGNENFLLNYPQSDAGAYRCCVLMYILLATEAKLHVGLLCLAQWSCY